MNLQHFLDLSAAQSEGDFRRLLEWFVAQMGFEKYVASMVYGPTTPGGEVAFASMDNLPEAFAARITPENARRDPVNKRLRTLSVPFAYDRSVYEEAGAADLWDEQAMFGYKAGIAVALHLPGDKHFLLGMDRNQPLPTQGEAISRMLADLQLVAVHAQVCAEKFLPNPVPPPLPSVRLSPRERQVLQWSMHGKSNWVIGEILGISENSVKFHLKNAMRKLDTSTKQTAVLKAVALRLL